MKKIIFPIAQFLGLFLIISLALKLNAFAINTLPIENDIFLEGGIPVPPSGDGKEIARMIVFGALGYAKILAGVLGMIFLTIMGFRLVIRGENEEEITNTKRGFIFILIAFIMISMAEDIGGIFDMEKGTIIKSPQEILKRVALFDKQVEILITFMKYVLGSFATLMVIRYALKIITGGGNEDEVTKNRKSLLLSAGGLALIFVGDIFINKVFYNINKNFYTGTDGAQATIDLEAGISEIVGITNFILKFVGPIAVLMLIVGAIMYATAGGDQERMDKAKRLLLTTMVGIVIIFGSFAIVSTIISGEIEGVNEQIPGQQDLENNVQIEKPGIDDIF